MHDLIIIGGGPAGMTAALYAARKALDLMVITEEFGGQLMWTRGVENYMGYQFITGPELTAKFEEQVKQFSLPIVYDKATRIAVNPDHTFTVTGEAGSHQSRSVILATGKSPRRLNVPGEKELTGRGVSYCATCDGPLFAGKTVAVVGGGNSALQAALELDKIAEKVYLVARSKYVADPILIEKLKNAKKVEEVFGYESQAIEGKDMVEKYVIRNKGAQETKELPVQGVFVEVGLLPNSQLAANMLERNEIGEILVDCRTRTNIPGLCAAGDVTDTPDKQIVIAAGEGAKAALVIYDYLMHERWSPNDGKK